jgi:hypothetical protein
MSNPVGRPRLFATPEEFDEKVAEYLVHCKEESEPVTWTGLALFLGFACRASIDEYLKYDGFSYSVKRAKALVEHQYERRLFSSNPTGAIFALKNFGWIDKQAVDLSNPDGSLRPEVIERRVVDPKSPEEIERQLDEQTHAAD